MKHYGNIYDGAGNLLYDDSTKKVPDARLTANVPLLNANNVFTGSKNMFGTVAGYTYITDDQLNFRHDADANAAGYINWSGYNNSTTRFRDLVIANGKQLEYARFDGVNQRFGIGTAAPTTNLEVYANAATPSVLRLSNGATSGEGARMEWWSGYPGPGKVTSKMWSGASGTNGADFSLQLLDQTSAALTTRIYINNAGNIGVGLATPGAALHVKTGGTGAIFETTTARGSGNAYLQWNDPTGIKGYVGYIGSDDRLYVYNAMNAAMLFVTNGVTRAEITASGVAYLGWNTGLTTYAAYFDTANAPGSATPVFLSTNIAGVIAYRRVELGAADSGGVGYRMLRIAN
jgi:hypothetical protein